MQEIRLRILAHKNNNVYFAICLETDIAIQANSIPKLKSKMRDAILSYFKSFTKEEVESCQYIRKAPLEYRIKWNVISCVRFAKQLLRLMVFNINYNPTTHKLQVA
jgi:hypothetical protein